MSKREKKNSDKRRSAKPRKAHPAPESTERSVQTLYFSDLKGVAKWFGIAYQTAKDWKRNGAPERTKRGYDIRAWTLWKVHRPPARCEEELRLKHARAEAVELANAKIKGELVKRVDAERRVEALCRVFSDVLDRAGAELAVRLPGRRKDTMKIVDTWQSERRRELVKQARAKPGPDDE